MTIVTRSFFSEFCLVLLFLGVRLALSNSSDDPSESQNRNLETRIVGGSFADRKRFPYFTLISMVKDGIPNYSYYGYCGGTLVARDVVITAATCVVDSHENSTNVWVNASSFQPSKYVYHRQVRKFVLHPKFEYSYYDANMENNIALIFLDKPVMGVPLVKLNRNASVPLSSDPPPLTAIGLGAVRPSCQRGLRMTFIFMSPSVSSGLRSSKVP